MGAGKLLSAAALWLLLGCGLALAEDDAAPPPPDPCALPESLTSDDSVLHRTASALTAGNPLRIVVMGSVSSLGFGTSGLGKGYPHRLEDELRQLLPNAKPVVLILARLGQTAADMFARIERDVLPRRPNLVIWQTGTVDARRAVSFHDFARVVNGGIEQLHHHGIDVILMDMQYSPKSLNLGDYETYQDYLQQLSDRNDVILVRRYDMMRHWHESGDIRLDADDKTAQERTADQVHACIARHMARMIVIGLRAAEPEPSSAPER